MDELQQLHKFLREVDHLKHQLGNYPPTEQSIDLVVAQSKRCRKECNNLVRAFARTRDQLQANKEATSE